MDLVSHVTVLGGACSRGAIVERCGRGAVEGALRDGTLLRVARGRYALASASAAVRAAATVGGVLSMRSAAQRHGWGQKQVPQLPDVTFPRNHHLPPAARRLVVPHWSDIAPEDIEDGMTGVRRTLVDCMRMLPLDEGIAIADRPVRAGDGPSPELRGTAREMRGGGRAGAMPLAERGSAKPMNPYESTLRAIAST